MRRIDLNRDSFRARFPGIDGMVSRHEPLAACALAMAYGDRS